MTTEGQVDRAEILPLLGAVKRSGEWLMAYCPAHADGSKHNRQAGQSLGLSDAGVLRCFAGCSFPDVMAGLRADAPRNRDRRPSADGAWPREPVAAYEYRDTSGALLAVKARFERASPDGGKPEKRFLWRLPDGDYRDGIKARFPNGIVDLPLWGAAEIAAADPGRRIWFAEGESATLAIRARNELATCGPWGAGQRDFGEALELLRGRDVILWPDNDAPGREYMAEVRKALRGLARNVAIVSAPVPPKGDAVEYFQTGGTIEHLLAGVLTGDVADLLGPAHIRVRMPTEAGEIRFEAADLAEGTRDLDAKLTVTWCLPAAESPYSQRINLLSASACEALSRVLGKHFTGSGLTWISLINRAVARISDVLASIDITDYSEPDPDARPAPFVIDGLVVEGGGTILHGLPKRGKSQASLAMAVTADAGLHTGVFRVNRRRPVLYINLERSRESMLARLARVNMALGLDSRRPLRFIHARGQGLAAILPKVRKAVRDHGIEVVVLDSISRGGFGDLNANQVGNAWIDALNSLGVAWLAIGHQPRPQGDGGAPHLYGSIFQDAGADVLASLQSKQEGPKLLVTINVTDANDFANPDPLDLVYEFDEAGLTTIRRAIGDELVELEEHKVLTVKETVFAALRDEGPAKSGELAKRLKKSQSNISRELGSLSRDGLVVRADDGTWKASEGQPYHSSYHDNYRDNAGIGRVIITPTPFGGGGDNTRPDNPDDEPLNASTPRAYFEPSDPHPCEACGEPITGTTAKCAGCAGAAVAARKAVS